MAYGIPVPYQNPKIMSSKVIGKNGWEPEVIGDKLVSNEVLKPSRALKAAWNYAIEIQPANRNLGWEKGGYWIKMGISGNVLLPFPFLTSLPKLKKKSTLSQ